IRLRLFAHRVRDRLLELCEQNENWQAVSCLTNSGEARSAEEIQHELRDLITSQMNLQLDSNS
ncbi:MAG TPA: hypothetical protein DIW81_26770, partial [Planctomycetaceae bacterium]|nr:hypothetical protein [Planctomycetaceae bacterium]